jgi:hypothetical protein
MKTIFLLIAIQLLLLSAVVGGKASKGKVSSGSKGSASSGNQQQSKNKKALVAVPRSKGASKKGGRGKSASLFSGFGQGIVGRVFREMKQNFCSELEALTLQLTR